MLRKLEAKNPDAHVSWINDWDKKHWLPYLIQFAFDFFVSKVPIDRVDVPLYELCEDGSYDIKNRSVWNTWRVEDVGTFQNTPID
jgi:hypothetical protein